MQASDIDRVSMSPREAALITWALNKRMEYAANKIMVDEIVALVERLAPLAMEYWNMEA